MPIYNAAYAGRTWTCSPATPSTWHNDSVRAHTVNADDGSWTSPRLTMMGSCGAPFDAPGTVAYYCELHPTMRGDIGVHRVLLSTPRDAGGARQAVPADRPRGAARGEQGLDRGRRRRRRDGEGRRARRVHRDRHPAATTTYTAVAGGESGPPVQVLVLDRKVSASAKHSRKRVTVTATVTPASPGATVVLQLKLKERFGWWPVRTAKTGAGFARARSPTRAGARSPPGCC